MGFRKNSSKLVLKIIVLVGIIWGLGVFGKDEVLSKYLVPLGLTLGMTSAYIFRCIDEEAGE